MTCDGPHLSQLAGVNASRSWPAVSVDTSRSDEIQGMVGRDVRVVTGDRHNMKWAV